MPDPPTSGLRPVMATLDVDRWLQERVPAPDLARHVARVWRGDIGCARIPVPDEHIDLVWVDNGSMWLVGPETRSWSRDYPPGTSAVGAGFSPGVGPAALRLAGSEVRDRRIPLEAIWGDRKARGLTERVTEQPDHAGRALVLEEAVRQLLADARPVDELALEVAAGLGRPQPPSARELSRLTGLSERQIHRRCSAAFGYGPALLARILRLRRLLHMTRATRQPPRLADLAAAAGYSDQQHLTHEIRAVFGTTPSRLLRSA